VVISLARPRQTRFSTDGVGVPHPILNNKTRRGGFRALAREAHAQYGKARLAESSHSIDGVGTRKSEGLCVVSHASGRPSLMRASRLTAEG
jgi:hypothetical protein